MPKPKHFVKAPKSSRPAPKEPEDENDFLEAADDFEKTGGKWRAGDAAKAVRFFRRAIEVYGQGLAKFPKSFDLHYNKARLLYDICEDERTSSFFSDDIVALLKEALQAHRAALELDNANPDILFNTAQVQTSLAEALDDSEDHDQDDASKLVQEAIELFSSCLDIQEREYTASQTLMQQSDTMTDAKPTETDTSSTPPSKWATVLEPTTPTTLLDTALALLSALTTLLTIRPPASAPTVTTISTLATPLLTTKIPSYIAALPTTLPASYLAPLIASLSITSTSATFTPDASSSPSDPAPNPRAAAAAEAGLTSGSFTSALRAAEYRLGQLTPSAYLAAISAPFDALVAQANTPLHVLAHAHALAEGARVLLQTPGTTPDTVAGLREQALGRAAGMLVEASKAPDGDVRVAVEVYAALGDVCMARGVGVGGKEEVVRRQARAAGVYYRGAAGWARKGDRGDGALKERGDGAVVRGLVAEVVAGGEGGFWERLRACPGEAIVGELEEMVEEGLLEEGLKGEIEERLRRGG